MVSSSFCACDAADKDVEENDRNDWNEDDVVDCVEAVVEAR